LFPCQLLLQLLGLFYPLELVRAQVASI